MIYRDCLGNPESKANISVFGAQYGRPNTGGYLALTASSDAPYRKWDYTSRDVSVIVAEMEAEGWECVVSKDGYNAPMISLTHKETRDYLEKIEKEIENKFANAEKGYLRFGKVPKDGKSYNYRDNFFEIGVSCFCAEFAGTEFRVSVDDTQYAEYLCFRDTGKPVYRIWGEEIGTGSAGEPLLKVTKSVKIR